MEVNNLILQNLTLQLFVRYVTDDGGLHSAAVKMWMPQITQYNIHDHSRNDK